MVYSLKIFLLADANFLLEPDYPLQLPIMHHPPKGNVLPRKIGQKRTKICVKFACDNLYALMHIFKYWEYGRCTQTPGEPQVPYPRNGKYVKMEDCPTKGSPLKKLGHRAKVLSLCEVTSFWALEKCFTMGKVAPKKARLCPVKSMVRVELLGLFYVLLGDHSEKLAIRFSVAMKGHTSKEGMFLKPQTRTLYCYISNSNSFLLGFLLESKKTATNASYFWEARS